MAEFIPAPLIAAEAFMPIRRSMLCFEDVPK